MMKKLGLTQRVTYIEQYDERRDSLDQRWWALAQALDFMPIALPNLTPAEAANYVQALDLSAIIMTGGNTLAFLDPTDSVNAQRNDLAPERDAFEWALMDWGIKQQIPMVGVCRGMQVINHYFGGTLVPMNGHIATRHDIQFCNQWEKLGSRTVNSYHGFGLFADNLADVLEATAQHEDGSIEAFMHSHEKIAGIMWHPEREKILSTDDIDLLKTLLNR